jgi:hypothetical protein
MSKKLRDVEIDILFVAISEFNSYYIKRLFIPARQGLARHFVIRIMLFDPQVFGMDSRGFRFLSDDNSCLI